MPNCKSCGRSVGRLIDGRVCGICDIQAAGKAPGFIGRDYRGQINPDFHQEAKELEIGLTQLENHPDPKQRISSAEAARFKQTLVRPAQMNDAFNVKNKDQIQRSKDVSAEAVRDGESQIRSEAAATKHKLGGLLGMASVVGPPEKSRP